MVAFWLLSVVVFAVIQPTAACDFLTSYIAALQEKGSAVDEAEIAALKKQYGLDAGPIEQYVRWFGKFLRGDMERSFEWNQPVAKLLKERLPYTIMLSLFTLVFNLCGCGSNRRLPNHTSV